MRHYATHKDPLLRGERAYIFETNSAGSMTGYLPMSDLKEKDPRRCTLKTDYDRDCTAEWIDRYYTLEPIGEQPGPDDDWQLLEEP